MSYFDTDKLVVLAYPKGAGGKFVSNCLALSQGVFPFVKVPTKIYLPKDPQGRITEIEYYQKPEEVPGLSVELLDELLNKGDVEFRLAYVLQSLPESRAAMKQWRNKYEFSCHHTYGYGENSLRKTSPAHIRKHILSDPPEMGGIFRKLHASGLLHFMNCHRPESYAGLLELFPNCQRLRFVNGAAWIRRSDQLGKFQMEKIKVMPDHPDDSAFSRSVDFDSESFFEEKYFIQEIRKLYEFFGLNDYNEQAMLQFYRRYIDLHS